MKKRILPILIILAALMSLLVLPTNAAETSNTLQAGYHKITIDPYNHPDGPIVGLPMGGYGAVTERLSGTNPDTVGEGKTIAFNSDARMDDNGDGKIDSKDGLFATCTAITDKNGNTIIHFGVDNTNSSTGWTNQARLTIAKKLQNAGYGVSYNNIFITASHSHSSPQLTYTGISGNDELVNRVSFYREWVFNQMGDAAIAAMKDREPVTLTKASVDASDAIGAMYSSASDNQKRMNWVRHYKSYTSKYHALGVGDTYVGGSNFGGYASYDTSEVSAPNDVMQLVQFTPTSGSKDPILLVNWTAHSTMNSSGGSSGYSTSTFGRYHHYNTSADYPGALRSALETGTCYDATIKSNYFSKVSSTQTYRVSFISGAAGNVTPSTSIMTSSQDPDVLATNTTIGYEKDPAGHLYGQKLAAIARYGLANKLETGLDNTGDLRVQTKTFTYDIQKATDFDTAFVNALKSYKVDANGNISDSGTKNLLSYLVTNSTTWAKKSDTAYTSLTYTYNNKTYDFTYLNKFTSRYQLSNLNGRVVDTNETGSMTVSAIAIGKNLAFTVNPCELADRFSTQATLSSTTLNDWDNLVDSSTYGTPLIMGYTNGGEGYVPNKLAYNYNSGSTSSGGDGADTSDKFITGSYESSGAEFAAGTGEQLVVFYKTMLNDLKNGTETTDGRYQCECGGKAVGINNHICSNVEFLPWEETTSLPASGNYYLTKDVVLDHQVSIGGILSLDLNGHSITHKVAAEQGELAEAGSSHNTRVFSLINGAHLTITDSTANPGTVSRDLSALTTEQKAAITNWGLLILINDGNSATLYNGTLDATGMYSGGGSCISLQDKRSAFSMYGGALKGGISDNGSVYIAGDAEFYGGTVTGGVTKNAGGAAGGLRVVSDGSLTIGGSVVIKDNKKSNGNPVNIRFSSDSKMATNFFVKGEFTGQASFYYGSTRSNGLIVGKSINASFTKANLYQDINKDYDVTISGNDIILATVKNQCECGGKASGKTGHTCKKVDFVPWTSTTTLPSSGNYYLTENVITSAQTNLTGTLHLDLNGKTITHKVSANEGAKAEAGSSHNTRVLSVANGGYLSITDSTDTPGIINRDLSSLTDTQKSKITNYGLILLVGDGGSATVYNGHLDSTGAQTTGGGGCVSNNYASSNFTMYGGQLTGCAATSSAGVLYNKGTATIYGGTFTGGKSDKGGFAFNVGTLSIFGGTITDNRTINNGTCPGIYCDTNAMLTIGGNPQFSENRKYNSNGTSAMNVLMDLRFVTPANMATNFTVSGAFTGTINFYLPEANRAHGFVVGKNDNASFSAENISEAYYTNKYDIALDGENIILAEAKTQCECGGKAAGKYGHTCETLTWKPWNNGSALPTDAGNYYLTTDVVTTTQKSIGAAIRIDLNGHNITHKVKAGSTNTRVFYIGANGSLVITDSTNTPGKVTRDLSNLTTAQKEAITNYGLIVMTANVTNAGSFTLYNGTLDASGMYTYGGTVACLSGATSVKIYGGTIKGGIANIGSTDGGSGRTGAIYSASPVEIHGGTITGSTAMRGTGAVYFTKTLLLTGDPTITGNVDANGNACNIGNAAASKITVAGEFTGTVGFNVTAPANGAQLAMNNNADISGATLTIDNQPSYSVAVSGSYLIMRSAYMASVTANGMTTYLDSLSDAIATYPGGDAVITILQDSNENVTFTQDTVLDLNGCDLTGTVNANGKLTVMDSQTDDLTISDTLGYGKLPASLSAAEAADGYVKIAETDGISFHRLVVQTVGINLRSSTAGLYYTSDFGGDEVIKRNIKSFGVALGANKEPDFRDKTYTAFSSDKWIVGANSDGSTKNRTNGTILQGILSEENTYSVNRANAATAVWGVAYVELLDGTRITEDNTVKYSLRQIIEGYPGFDGVDDLWSSLNDAQKSDAVDMYKTFIKVMQNWDIPNIKQGVIDAQDDGILKVLVIGHSLGMDASYFTPLVARENDTEMVLGALYHSGCTLKQHEDFINRNVTEYAYIEFDNRTDTSWRIWENNIGANAFVTHVPGQAHDEYIGTGSDDKYGVTMQFGIQQHDWDIIIMMAGSSEGTGQSLDVTDVGVIRNHVLNNDANKLTTPEFAWNMTWSYPESTSVHGNNRTDAMNTLMNSFNNDSDAMFAALADVMKNQITKQYAFKYLLPNGTAVQNLKSTGMTDEEIYRDRVHASDYTRLLAACNWYCGLTGEDVADITVPDVPAALRYKAADRKLGDYKLQADEKSLIKSCVSNALSNPYEITQIANDDVFKVLVIGHSTGMDPVYFMPAIAKANGQKMLVGDLYHSGCTLRQHDSYIKNNSKEYAYLEYDNSTDTAWRIWETEEGQNKFVTHLPNQAHDSYIGAAATKAGNPNKYGVTMEWAIKQHDWDLIIMMGGRWECADITVSGSELDITDIGAIRNHVLTNDIDKTTIPAFAWNSLWTSPENDEEWKATLTSSAKTSYESRWATIEQYFQGSTQCLYESMVRGLKNIILPEYSFDHLIHNSTLIQNAKNNGLTNYDIYRDYGHCTDYVRAMSAANWYCSITGADVSEITIPDFQAELRFKTADRNTGNPFVLTADQKALIVKLVGDTIANPFEVTK